MVLSEKELSTVVGGKASYGLYALIGGAITLIVGIIDGYLRPLSCNR